MRRSGQGGGARSSSAVIGFVLFITTSVFSPVLQADADTEHDAETAVAVQLAPHSAAWFLEMMRRLLHQGRAGESYQLAQIAVAQHPDAPDLRLGAAYAAIAGGRCDFAKRHLAMLHSHAVSAGLARLHLQRRDMLTAQCHGPWSRRLLARVTTGYRTSLTDRARHFQMQPEPGSQLHGLCVRLAGLCDPRRPFTGSRARDSGIDMWAQFHVEHNYRAGTAWDADIGPLIFRRQPSRSGYTGQGAILRADARRHLPSGRQLQLSGETGVARFHQGDPSLAFSQSHRRLQAAFVIPHTHHLTSRIGHGRTWVKSRFLDLHRRRHDYWLNARLGERSLIWLGVAGEHAGQSGSGRLIGSRSRIFSFGGRRRMSWLTASLWQQLRREKFTRPLFYLAVPHSATTRTTGLDLTPNLPEKLNFKVVLSFNYRKISSPDTLLPGSTKTLMLSLRYSSK